LEDARRYPIERSKGRSKNQPKLEGKSASSFHTPFKVEEMTPRDVSDLFSGKKKSLNDKNKNN
jgi:hypothetical protein